MQKLRDNGHKITPQRMGVAALQAVGIILTVAMPVTPGCIAHLLSDRFDRMLLVAVTGAVVSSVAGTYISYFLNGSTGACIVLTQAFFFALALVLAPTHVLLARCRAVARVGHSQMPAASCPT